MKKSLTQQLNEKFKELDELSLDWHHAHMVRDYGEAKEFKEKHDALLKEIEEIRKKEPPPKPNETLRQRFYYGD